MNAPALGTSKELPNELWVVLDPSDNDSVYSAPYEEACHEHINEAIDEDIDGAGSWVVRRFVSAHEPEALRTIPGQTTDDDLKRLAWSFDSSGAAGAIHHFRFRERDLLALLRQVQETAQRFERASQPPGALRIGDCVEWNCHKGVVQERPTVLVRWQDGIKDRIEVSALKRRDCDAHDEVPTSTKPSARTETPPSPFKDVPMRVLRWPEIPDSAERWDDSQDLTDRDR